MTDASLRAAFLILAIIFAGCDDVKQDIDAAMVEAEQEAANPELCGQRLRLIGWAMKEHATANGGVYANDFAAIVDLDDDITNATFTCPDGDESPAAPPFVLGKNLSYRFTAFGQPEADLNSYRNVIGYCVHEHAGLGANLLLGDGAVELRKLEDLPPDVQLDAAGR